MSTALRFVISVLLLAPAFAFAEEGDPQERPTGLRHFNPEIFGKPTTEPVLLLTPAKPRQVDPETVMVDIGAGEYYAATVRYPNEISLADARRSLNELYAQHEMKDYNKSTGGALYIWRNEQDRFVIQLCQEGDTLVVIYISLDRKVKQRLIDVLPDVLEELRKEAEQELPNE